MSKVAFKQRTYKEFFRDWGFSSIHLNLGFAEIEFEPNNDDMTAAWNLYVELLTRISTQPIADEDGDEASALNSIYDLFGITRMILREKGFLAENFTKISIIILNQVVRPFTSKWHKKSISGAFDDKDECALFRNELRDLQKQLIQYTRMLSELACVEDLTDLVCDNEMEEMNEK